MPKSREHEKAVESESESVEEESGDEESDEEESPAQVLQKASSAAKPQQQQQAASSGEEEEGEDEEEDDSGSESEGFETQKSNVGTKHRSKLIVTPTKSTVTKRLDVKKAKQPETPVKKSNDDSKKLLFQRLWSEDDEIAILKGMIEYANKKKSDPVTDLNAFHDFIRKNLHVDVTGTQLKDKIRRLRKKYENNKSKEKEGKGRTFTNPHEQKAYDLSKSIWGNEGAKENGGEKSSGSLKANDRAAIKRAANTAGNEDDKGWKSMVVVSGDGEMSGIGKRVNSGGWSVEEVIMAAGSELFESGKGLEGERQWKKLRVEEVEVHLRQLEVKAAQTRLVLDVLKSKEH